MKDNIKPSKLRLSKMLYVAHGLFYAKYEKSLIIEMFIKYQYGPLSPRLYQDLQVFKTAQITGLLKDVVCIKEEIVTKVYAKFKDCELSQLIQYAHGSFSQNLKEGEIIQQQDVQEEFRAYLEQWEI